MDVSGAGVPRYSGPCVSALNGTADDPCAPGLRTNKTHPEHERVVAHPLALAFLSDQVRASVRVRVRANLTLTLSLSLTLTVTLTLTFTFAHILTLTLTLTLTLALTRSACVVSRDAARRAGCPARRCRAPSARPRYPGCSLG